MQGVDLILTLAVALAAALVLGYLAKRLHLSPVVGYLVAGILLGPATPGFNADRETASQLADIGVVLLMFGVGLQFHVREFLAVRRIALVGALAHTVLVTALGAAVFVHAGGHYRGGIVFGFALSMASTVVLIRTLSDSDHLHTAVGHIAVGWEVLKDLFTVVALVLIPLFFAPPAEGGNSGGLSLLLAVAKVIALLGVTFVVGSRLIPWLLNRVAATRSRELFTLTILALALGIAVLSARVAGVSMALGALLAGFVVGRSEFSFRAASEALPMRDAFAVLFFVSAGMLVDPAAVVRAPQMLLLTLAVIMVAKPLIALAVCIAAGHTTKVGLGVAAALGQVGEFSFILATLGLRYGFFTAAATNALIAGAIVSISANSIVYRTVAPIDRRLLARWGAWRRFNTRVAAPPQEERGAHRWPSADPAHRAVVVGHGPVGRTLVRLLQEQGIEPSVIEMNLQTVRELKRAGIDAVFGDATLGPTLEEAGVASAATLALTVSGFTAAPEVIKMARELNPDVHILARAAYLADVPALRQAGADRVFSGEGEVALGMTEHVLSHLGATPEQIDRERERVHGELF